MAAIAIKRVYEPAASKDGLRILVDRIWPRGLAKKSAKFDHWLKDVAPTTELRKWFGHKPEKWSEFRRRYHAELSKNPAADELHALIGRKHATLLYAAHDEKHNHARVLAEYLLKSASNMVRSEQ